jgi:hypothetical protein
MVVAAARLGECGRGARLPQRAHRHRGRDLGQRFEGGGDRRSGQGEVAVPPGRLDAQQPGVEQAAQVPARRRRASAGSPGELPSGTGGPVEQSGQHCAAGLVAHQRGDGRSNRSASFGAQLSGGDPRTLGDVDVVVSDVLAQPQRLDELMNCVIESNDEIVRMRASDALEKICRARPALLQPHVALLLGKVSRVDQPSVRWHVAR